MRTNLVRVVGVWVLLAGAGFVLTGCPQFVFFSDSALDSAVRAAIQKPFGIITEGDLLQMTELQASNLKITSLDGLEYCKSLTVLNLQGNSITSIAPLAGLMNLTWLNLEGNSISNIVPLAGLLSLEYVDISGANNDIRQWAPLVANADAGGLGAGDIVTVDSSWTVQSDGTFYADFQPYYQALLSAGVDVIVAKSQKSAP